MPGKRKKNLKEIESKVSPNACKSNCICEAHNFDDSETSSIQANLLEWFDKEQRSLPWRDIAKNETDENIRGYSVWVSEVMLQQTQVATVIPYFNKWIKKWPSVKDLAEAELEEVLQTWAGLGYYGRGRRLHEGAKLVMEKLQGRVPQDVSELTKVIPGIGAYSAAAIASVAFRKVAGVVDGNVIRVLSRMRVIGQPASVPNVRDHLWKLANQLVSRRRPGDFNQALMELGAMVCTPQNPSCASCPVSSFCHVYSMTKTSKKDGALDPFLKNTKDRNIENIPDIENAADCSFCVLPSVWKKNPQVTAFPFKAEKKSSRKETVKVVIIEHSKKFLTVRRPDKGLLAGLLEFPSLIVPEGCSDLKSDTLLQPLMKELSVSKSELKSKKHVGEIVHLFSHIHTTYDVEHLVLSRPLNIKDGGRETLWISDEEIKTAAISTAMKKVFSLVEKSEKKPAAKSWKTKPEDLIVYKKKLEKENTRETVILRTLALLNYASKESIVSHEIDKTLKALAASKNTKIATEAKFLIDHWRLNGPEPQATKDSFQASAIQKNTDIVETDQKKLKSPSTDISETKMQMPSTNKGLSLSESSHKTLKKDPTIAVKPKITWTKPTEKIGLKKVEERKMDPLKHKNSGSLFEEFSNKSVPKTNQRSYSKGEIKLMKERIETISKFFLETLGMQQVKLYLDH